MNPKSTHPNEPLFSPSRRRFVQGAVQGIAISGAFAGLGLPTASLWAATGKPQGLQTLRGTDFDLTIAPQTVNFTGQLAMAMTVNGGLPAPILRWKEGDTVTLRVTNRLPVVSSIHWHGIILPSAMDGVPGVATGFHGIAPDETFTYRFKVNQSGTYWYHSHSGFQEQSGLYGPIVIDPKEREAFPHDRDYVVMLSDWTDETPMAVYAKLKKLSHYYNFNERTHTDLMKDIGEKGLSATWDERVMWSRMRMSPRDLSDVTGFTYTYLMNGETPADGWAGLFRKGEKIRLRFINSAAMTFFDVRIPGLSMTVVAADGQDVQPVRVDEFRIGVAETYDVIVEPDADRAYTIFAQDIARSGYARGTLAPLAAPSLALSASIPALDPVPELGHDDMGMGGMNHEGHGMPGMDHGRHSMHGMVHGTSHAEHAMPSMDHRQHQMSHKPNPSDFTAHPVHHATTEYGPHVDMRAENPQYRLDDPGVGLRNNGRRVLTYADLRNPRPTSNQREPDREIELHLTGNMRRYMWSIDGVKHADAKPLRWKLGERLRITLVNDTMMNHPMHLHGMWSDLETGDNNYLPRKHTVIVQPGARISYRVAVDAEGGWAYHCHLLYHMPGMFRTVIVG